MSIHAELNVSPTRRPPFQVGRGAFGAQDVRQQLVWFAWLRLVVITTALVTTLLLDLVIEPQQMVGVDTTPLYVVLAGAYLLSFLNLAVLSRVGSTAVIAAIQFGGDILVETALLAVLGTENAIAFAVALYFLTTLLACSYLDRVQGTAFATGAFFLQAFVHLLAQFGFMPAITVNGTRPFADPSTWNVVLRLFIFMGTFSVTAWLVGLRQERIRVIGDRLQSVSHDLAELQAFNERVVLSISSALVTTDLSGRITHANPAAQGLFGASNDELQGRSLHDLLGWEERIERDLEAARRVGTARRLGRDAMLGGRRVSLDVSLSRLEAEDGEALGVLFLFEDVTELKSLEAEVRLKEQMAAIGEMAAGIAHEIRNPLASISGSVQMLRRDLALDGPQSRLMDIVLRESRRLDSSIGEFLQYARPREPCPRAIDLGELVRETLTLLRNSAEVNDSHVIVEGARPATETDADPDQLRQVIWNLCRNALKAMPDGGRLGVDVFRDGNDVVLRVEDSGVGMSPDVRERAFQPMVGEFGDGMGLGLAIVYRIVEDHGGRVDIDSEAGRGTRIDVRLPGPSARTADRTA